MKAPSTNIPRIPVQLDPDHIERTLANSNELMRQVFAAQGLDGRLRTKDLTQDPRKDRAYGVQPIYFGSGYRFFGSGL